MKGISLGDEIMGEKIILEAGHVDLEKYSIIKVKTSR